MNDLPITALGFSNRTSQRLKERNIISVYQLCLLSRAELLKGRNVGWKTIDEISHKLSERGLSLLDQHDELPFNWRTLHALTQIVAFHRSKLQNWKPNEGELLDLLESHYRVFIEAVRKQDEKLVEESSALIAIYISRLVESLPPHS